MCRQGALSSARAQTAWQKAIDAASLELTQRDNIEMAAAEVRHISDSAYYYACLAFGLVFASVHALMETETRPPLTPRQPDRRPGAKR